MQLDEFHTHFVFKNKSVDLWIYAILGFTIVLIYFILSFEVYIVQNESMEDTFSEGDFILVRRLNNSTLKNARVKKSRDFLNSILIIKNVDVDRNKCFIKRCIGLPGDTLGLSNGALFNNSSEVPLTNSTTQIFVIKSKSFEDLQEYLNRMQTKIYKKSEDLAEINTTILTVKELLNKGLITNYRVKNRYSFYLRKDLENFNLIIPKEGDRCILYEHSDLGKYFLQCEKIDKMVGNNYYFFIGDNQDNSMDSRIWGVIPESYIVGEAKFILFSKGSAKGRSEHGKMVILKKIK